MHVVVDKEQVVISVPNDPVSQCISGKVNAVAFENYGLAIQQKGIRIFSVNDGSHERNSCDAVLEQISRIFCFNNGTGFYAVIYKMTTVIC